MRLLAPLHSAALTDPLTWSENPFIAREARRDAKRKQPYKALAWMSGMLLILGGLAFWGLLALHQGIHRIPWYLSGEFGAALCFVLSGIQIWFVAGAAQKHTTQLLTQESNQNTLNSLLLMPVPPFQLLLQVMVYPWLAAMRMALVGLPLYVFCVGLDGISWGDLIMLYVVFSLVAISVPVWIRPALSDTVAIVSPTTPAKTTTTTAAAQTARQARAAGYNAMPGGWLSLGFLIPFFALLSSTIRTRGFSDMYATMQQYFPDSLIVLLPSSLLSWPLIMARGLITPFDWFGHGIMPLPFALLLILSNRYALLTRASEFLSVGNYRDLALQPTYLPRRRLEGALKIAQALIVTGYLWKWAIGNDGLGFLAAAAKGVAPGLVGFACLLFLSVGWWAMIRASKLGLWLRPDKKRKGATVARQVPLLSALRYVIEPFVLGLGFYLVCCGLARAAPFPPVLSAMAGRMLAIGAAGTLMSFGVSRGLGQAGMFARVLLPVSILAGVICYKDPDFAHLMTVYPGLMPLWNLILSLRHLVIFSPFMGLIHEVNPAWYQIGKLTEAAPVWWRWPLAGSLTGVVGWAFGMLFAPRRSLPETEPETLLLDPTKVGEETFYDPILARQDPNTKADTPLVRRLVAALQRVADNPIVTRELRTRLRGKLESNTVRGTLVACLLISVIVYQYLSVVVEALGGWLAALLYGSQLPGAALTVGSILACFYFVLLLRAVFSGFVTFSAFNPEMQKSTLSFLLATPLRGESIVLGKAAGMLIPSGLFFITLGGWTLLLSLFCLPLLGPAALWVWFAIMLAGLSVFCAVGMTMLAFAALFPRLSLTNAGWLVALLIYGGIGGAGVFIQALVTMVNLLHISAGQLCLLFIVFNSIVILTTYLLALWGIRRMRSRDLDLDAARRGS